MGYLYAAIIAIIVLFALSIWLVYSKGYRQQIVIPQRLARRQKIQEIAGIFDDLANISRLLVIHLLDGICIFDHLGEKRLDASLMSGFLQAISAFHVDSPPSDGLEEKPKAAPLREIQYKDSRILIQDGQLIRSALVLRGAPSEKLRIKLEEFTTRFEERFHDRLEHWFGKVAGFEGAKELVEEIFQISLLLPHMVESKIRGGVHRTSLEIRLHNVALELSRERGLVYLFDIASKYLAANHEERIEVLNAVYQLREKGFLVPSQSSSQ